MAETNRYDVPQHVIDAIRNAGWQFPYGQMRSHIAEWSEVMRAHGDFWEHDEREGSTAYRVRRMTVHPARRVCEEWSSLLLNDRTRIVAEDQQVTDWLAGWVQRSCFWSRGQGLVADAFGLGTAAWALWVDAENGRVKARRHDARMTLPLSWDDDGVTECAFATRARLGGRDVDQLQMHVLEGGTYHVLTRLFDSEDGTEVAAEGVEADLDTRCQTPTFAVVTPAIPNTRVDFSPYGQSVFADCVDVMKSVDLCYDAIMREVDLAKMRVLMSETLFEQERKDGKVRYIPFGKADTSVFRRVGGSDDFIHEWAPTMRTASQREAYRMALQAMGDRCGFGSQYFDVDKGGGIRTATEVSSDNSALMRNIRKHENLLQGSIAQLTHALLHCEREFCGAVLPDEGEVRVDFDDSIITDTASEKAQDMAEVNVTMQPWEYRAKWYGEDEDTARANVPGSAVESIPTFG